MTTRVHPGMVEAPGGEVKVSRWLNASGSNAADALDGALQEAASRMASGRYSRVVVDADHVMLGLSRPVVWPAGLTYTTLRNFGLYPTTQGAAWVEDDPLMVNMFNARQTVTAEGKVWSLRKPLLVISDDTKGVELERFRISGQGDFASRVAAGVRVIGASTLRKSSLGYIENVESYGIVIGDEAMADNGEMDLDRIEIKPNGRTTRADRTSYGLVVSGNDMEFTRLAIWYAHCPVLITPYGATSRFVSHDFYNGASFDNTGFPHRVMEHWGNSNNFTGGRLGNGIVHMYSQDAVFDSLKVGFTDGTVALPPSMFRFYASKALDDLRSFVLTTDAEVPSELKNTIPWFSFEPATGGNSWAIDTVALGNIKGYVQTLPSGKTQTVQCSSSGEGVTSRSGNTGSYALYADATTTKQTGVGALGDALRLRTNDVDRWEVLSNGTLRPLDDNARSIGSSALRVANVYTVLLTLGSGVTITTGAGTPEGGVAAGVGSLFLRTDGGAGTTLYVKQSGVGNTGWAAK